MYHSFMAKKTLTEQLATYKKPKTHLGGHRKPSKPLTAPRPVEPAPPSEIISNPERELADKCAKSAMICGWKKAIQTTAYENQISEDRMRSLLDEALEYNDKADPSGKIHELEDWERERRGRSSLAASTSRVN